MTLADRVRRLQNARNDVSAVLSDIVNNQECTSLCKDDLMDLINDLETAYDVIGDIRNIITRF